MLTFTAVVLATTFALLPRIIFGSAYADMRLVPFLFAFALLAIRFRGKTDFALARVLALAALAFCLARTASVTWSHKIAADDYRAKLAALDHVPRGAAVVSFVGLGCTQATSWPMWRNAHLGGLVVVRREGFSNDHWPVAGAKLLSVTHQKAGEWRYDPSNLVVPNDCPTRLGMPVDWMLANFPREAFDYVWLLDPPPFDPRLLRGTTRVWAQPDGSALYRIDRKADKPGS
jgi:hypothetical protein